MHMFVGTCKVSRVSDVGMVDKEIEEKLLKTRLKSCYAGLLLNRIKTLFERRMHPTVLEMILRYKPVAGE